MKVFLLWHSHKLSSGEDDDKLCGVYSSKAMADEAQNRLSNQPGFAGSSHGFGVDTYTVDKDEWTEGFVSTVDWNWTVWRQDDNGSEVQMATGLSKDDAAAMVEKFTAQGHKQLYWVADDSAT